MATEDRLSDLPDAIIIHILSKLSDYPKSVVRTSVLSTRWRFLWMSVRLSLFYSFPHSSNGYTEKQIADFVASVSRELYYLRSSEKMVAFRAVLPRFNMSYAKDVDLWVHFATKVAEVDCLALGFGGRASYPRYEFPQFAYKNKHLKRMILTKCELNPFGSINWSCLNFLSIASLNLTDDALKKVLSGCPNLERLELDDVLGLGRLEVSSVKLTYLSIKDYQNENGDIHLEIFAPNLKYFEFFGLCGKISLQPRNVASLVSTCISLDYEDSLEERNLEEECSYFKELLHGVGHVQKLEFCPWCIQCMSKLELEGWQSPPSSRKLLKLNAGLESLDFPGIYSFLRSSVDLETLVIDWYEYNHELRNELSRYTGEDEHSQRFERDKFKCSLQHLKTINFDNFYGSLIENKSILSLVKYLLKNATMLEKFTVAAILEGSDASRDYAKMKQEFLRFPRSSPNASIEFSSFCFN